MSVTIVTPPGALVTAVEAKIWAPVLAGDDQARVDALLAVGQAVLEPPLSPYGRALGSQTLELAAAGFSPWCHAAPLPYGPIISIGSVKYDDRDGVEQTLPGSVYGLAEANTIEGRLILKPGQAWPAVARGENAVRIRYQAGHLNADPRLLPAKHAIVLSAIALRSLGTQDLALRSVEVPGLDTRTWVVSDAAQKLVKETIDSLLGAYWSPRV